jgi:integrase/recombinase XerD
MLNDAMENYLILRRTGGYKLVDTEELLRSCLSFVAGRGERFLRTETVIEWAQLGASVGRCERRLRTIGFFVDYLRVENPRHKVMPRGLFSTGKVHRHPPRIFTREEILRVLELTDALPSRGSIRPLTYRTLLGLLFVTGMRINEALALRLTDIEPAGLVIRQTKFSKSRQLPLHPSTSAILDTYLTARRTVFTHSDRLFLTWCGHRPLSRKTVLPTFQMLCEKAGIEGAGGRRKPRLHDLRHSFAVHALERCEAERDVVEQHMLALSTYLGHCSPTSTHWYLEQTPQLMRGIATACEAAQCGDHS